MFNVQMQCSPMNAYDDQKLWFFPKFNENISNEWKFYEDRLKFE